MAQARPGRLGWVRRGAGHGARRQRQARPAVVPHSAQPAPDGSEVVFQGALDPHTPIGQGWLRASHRKLDPWLSTEYRPYHTHDVVEPLTPGEVYELDVEIWPTCIVVPAGYRIALTVRGKDYEYPGEGVRLATFVNELKGCGPFLHDDPGDRPPAIFGGKNTLHAGGDRTAYVLLPIIPKGDSSASED